MFPVPFMNRGIFVDPDANTYFTAVAATGTALTEAQKTLINAFFLGLKADSLYFKIDGGNILCLTTAGQCFVDFKVPSRVATVYSSPSFIFTSKRGFAGDLNTDTVNTPARIDTGFNPSTAGGNWTDDSAFVGIYSHTSSILARTDAGISTAGTDVVITCRSTTDLFVGRVNAIANDTYMSGITDGSGFFMIIRTADAVSIGQRNEVQGSTIATSSGGLPNGTFRYLQVQGGTATNKQLSFGVYGGGLTAAEGLLLNTRVQTLVAGLRAL